MEYCEEDTPKEIVSEWVKQCDCCPECSNVPCCGVMAGGLCDNSCYCSLADYDYDLGN